MHGSYPWLRLVLFSFSLLVGVAAGILATSLAASAQDGLPSKPDIHTITSLHRGLRVYWWAPPSDGGSPITGYEVQYRASGTTAWTDAGHSGLAQPAVISGLRFNTSYEARVRAINANGKGPWSVVDSRRTSPDDGRPDPPWPPTLTAGDGKIEVSWQAPAYTGRSAILGYRVRYTTDDGENWRTWSVGGSRLITGASTTITRLDNGVLTGVVVAARNSAGAGRYSPHTPEAEATPATALTLSLESSRELCTANTLTELSWTITGGVPPYTLIIDGKKVDPYAEKHQVNCGPLTMDPQTEEPLPNQLKTFSVAVTDAQRTTVSEEVSVSLAPAVPAPTVRSHDAKRFSFTAAWDRVFLDQAGTQASHYLVRWRKAEQSVWTYIPFTIDYGEPNYFNPVPAWSRFGLSEGVMYEFSVAPTRAALERHSPNALSWTRVIRARTLSTPTNIMVTATHDTITVSWTATNTAPVRYSVVSGSSEGGVSKSVTLSPDDPQQITLIRLPPDTLHRLNLSMDASSETALLDVPSIRTLPAPPGWKPLPRGVRNLAATASRDRVTLTWDAPYPDARALYIVSIFEDEDESLSQSAIWHEWIFDRTTATFAGLEPGTKYRFKVTHPDGVTVDREISITTPPAGSENSGLTAQGATPVPEYPPYALPFGHYGWPVHYEDERQLTDDMWDWRSYGRHHGGMDIGHEDGHALVGRRSDPLIASADGVVRFFNGDGTLQDIHYCPDKIGLFYERFTTMREGTCNYVIATTSGTTALITHGESGAGPLITKYAHLSEVVIEAKTLARRISLSDGSSAYRIKRGEQIGYIGKTGVGIDHNHVHFEIRVMPSSPAALALWYGNGQESMTCAGDPPYRRYCAWDPERRMVSFLDPEAVLPPAPPIAPDRVVELVDLDVEVSKTKVALRTDAGRPNFYLFIDNMGRRASGHFSRAARTGIEATRPGVTAYRVAADCIRGGEASRYQLLSQPKVSEGALEGKFELLTDSTCALTVASVNQRYRSGLVPSGLYGREFHIDADAVVAEHTDAIPQAVVRLNVTHLTESGSPHRAALSGYAYHIYTFDAQADTRHRFCVHLNDNDDCSDRGALRPVNRDVVAAVWGNDGVVTRKVGSEVQAVEDKRDGEVDLSWTAGAAGVYALVLRPGYLCGSDANEPCGGEYTLHYSVSCPGSESAAGQGTSSSQSHAVRGSATTQQCPAPRLDPPTNLMISMVTGTTAKLSWESADTAKTGYRLALDGTPLSPQPALGGATSYTFTGLTTATTEHVFTVVATGDLILESEPAMLTLLLPPGNLGATATHDSITLSWNEVDRAERYELKRLAGGVACAGAGVQATVNDDGNAQTFRHTFSTGVEASERYTLCARAANAQGPSAWAKTTVTTSAGRCSSSRPTKPDVNGFRPLGTATTWAEPSGGQTAEMTSEQRQPQTRTVTWNSAECRWDAGGWTDEGDPYWTPPAATGQTRAAPAKPSESQTIVVRNEPRWAVPVGGQTAEEKRDLVQRQTRSVTWSTADCLWATGSWENDGSPSWSPWRATGVKRPAPAKPSESQTIVVRSETRWAVPVGGETAEEKRDLIQRQGRSVTWDTAACAWVVGRWVDVGAPYWGPWRATGVSRTAPAKPPDSQTIVVRSETRWALPVGGQTAEQQRDLVQRQARSVNWDTAACAWITGPWADVGPPSWTPWSATGTTRAAPAKPSATELRNRSTEVRAQVRGTTAYKQSRQVATQHRRTVSWDGSDGSWNAGEWNRGVPWSTPWEDTGEEIERPPTRTWTNRVNEARTGRTRVVRVQTTPICLEQPQEQLRYRIRYSAQAYVWDGLMSWVLGPVTRTTPPVWHTRWRDVGGQRLCTLGGQEEETPAADAGPTFGAGQHTLQWGAVWLRFTVPADASVLLAARADSARELTAVFSLAGGAELVVSPSALARGERPTSSDSTLASVAASLTLVEEPEQATTESGDTSCAPATPGSTTEPTRVDLNADDCTLISGGGTLTLAADEQRLSLTLPEGREWIAFAAPAPRDGSADAFWLVDAATGSLLALDPASGRELARQLSAGAADLGSLLNSIAGSTVAGG